MKKNIRKRKDENKDVRFRSYTYPLKPTPDQVVQMEQFAGVCRLIWNLALKQRINHWRQFKRTTGNNLNYVAQARELTALRREFDWIAAVSSTAQQMTLMNLEDAFERFFDKKGGRPKFKRKGARDSFSFPAFMAERINKRWGRVKVPKIGWIRFRWTRDIAGDIREATVTRTALGWQISFRCRLDGKHDRDDNGLIVGIDRGVTVPVMTSDGDEYHLPASIEHLERKHRKAQREVARKKRSSKRWRKAIRRAAAIKAKQARVRKHWAHEVTTDIARRYGTVVVENLNIKGMTKSAKGQNGKAKTNFNRAILNVGWYQLESMLAYKAARMIKVNPAYTSQTCASCGTVDSRSRDSQAVFVCTACGHRDNADRNAAIVILNRGSTPGVEPARGAGHEARTIQAAQTV